MLKNIFLIVLPLDWAWDSQTDPFAGEFLHAWILDCLVLPDYYLPSGAVFF